MRQSHFAAAAGIVALAGGFMTQASTPALALTMKECSTKYEAAKTGNTLGGLSWNDFRKAQCSDSATPAAAAPAAATNPLKPAAAAPAPAKPATTAATPAAAPAKPAMAAPAGNAVFPAKVDPKYSTLSAGKQRFKTCTDQYNLNKANGGNGDLKWIEKGGGYYSQCNTRLKGA
jgi:predicted lipid-binding transport protein (Tim44 family)